MLNHKTKKSSQFCLQSLLATLLLVGLIIDPTISQASFLVPDLNIPQGETIQLLIPKYDFTSAKGTFEGTPFTFYEVTKPIDPTLPISRAEFLQLISLNHNFGSASDVTMPFPDVAPNSQFYQAILAATKAGIINGYQDGYFHPYQPVTRGQAAKIMMNTFHPAQTIQDVPFFSDVPLDYSLRNEVYDSVRAGIFHGYPDGRMLPERPITFQEANLIIQRAAKTTNFITLPDRINFRAFLGIHRTSPLGNKKLEVELKDATGNVDVEDAIITVTKQNYTSQYFQMDTEKTDLFGQTYQDQTWAMIDAAKANPHPEQLWEGAFIMPATGEITTGFGDKLYINSKYVGSHFGLDIANHENTPVYASNSGIVTLASMTPAYGNVVVIDHGQNIFTMYLHNAELKVSPGDIVKKGDLIALMGATGIATGPHVHYTNFIGDIIVSPYAWLAGKY